MRIEHTPIEGLVVIHPTLFLDDRGYFFEKFNEAKFAELYGRPVHFVQDNQAKSTKNVLRGLHFQKGEFAQAKLVSAIAGTVLDVAVDLRPDSATYGKHYSIILSAENKIQLFVPRGFAHGYAVLSDEAEFFYKCDNYYKKDAEGGLAYNCPILNIDWNMDLKDAIISEKDLLHPTINEYTTTLNS
jgi:dTDP-4-dehydrorhamnose 3,5-epimerase